jgi:hypothetical protein
LFWQVSGLFDTHNQACVSQQDTRKEPCCNGRQHRLTLFAHRFPPFASGPPFTQARAACIERHHCEVAMDDQTEPAAAPAPEPTPPPPPPTTQDEIRRQLGWDLVLPEPAARD